MSPTVFSWSLVMIPVILFIVMAGTMRLIIGVKRLGVVAALVGIVLLAWTLIVAGCFVVLNLVPQNYQENYNHNEGSGTLIVAFVLTPIIWLAYLHTCWHMSKFRKEKATD